MNILGQISLSVSSFQPLSSLSFELPLFHVCRERFCSRGQLLEPFELHAWCGDHLAAMFPKWPGARWWWWWWAVDKGRSCCQSGLRAFGVLKVCDAVRKFKASIRVLSVFQSFKETRAAIHTTHWISSPVSWYCVWLFLYLIFFGPEL